MYTPTERARLRDELVERARADPNVTAAALVGSSARDDGDRWSDIDLALRLADGATIEAVASDWTRFLGDTRDVVHTLDVWAGPALYRVFLLPGTLQVDVSFWPSDRFAATSPAFRLLFGEANSPRDPVIPSADILIGTAWLYALHVRSSLARGRNWQAALLLHTLREQIVMLACLRHDLPTREGRSVDRLPVDLRRSLEATLAPSVRPTGLATVFGVAVELLLAEARYVDPVLADRLAGPVATMVATTGQASGAGREPDS